MGRSVAIGGALTLVLIALAVWVISRTSGVHGDLQGSILKVRTVKLDDEISAAVADIRLTSGSNVALFARNIIVSASTGNGDVQGHIIEGNGLATVFKNYPALGDQYNPVFGVLDEVPPLKTVDRELGVHFPISVEELDKRKDLVIRIEHAQGVLEMHERRR